MSDNNSSDLLARLGYQPRWCSLSMAARWVVDKRRPLSREDHHSEIGPVDVSDERFDQTCDDLIVALRNGLLKAKGRLHVFEPPHTSLGGVDADSVGVSDTGWTDFLRTVEPEFREPDRTFHVILARADYDIPPDLWDYRVYDWQESCLRSPWNVSPHVCFRDISVDMDQVAAALGDEAGPIKASSQRVGRSASYDWDGFYAELVVQADLDGVPEKPADLVRKMAQWCQKNWGKEPSESMLKQKISPIYNHPRRIASDKARPEHRRQPEKRSAER